MSGSPFRLSYCATASRQHVSHSHTVTLRPPGIPQATGIPYADMLFFDNERRNCVDVAPLGVTCVYTPDGLTQSKWDEGLVKFAAKSSSARGRS